MTASNESDSLNSTDEYVSFSKEMKCYFESDSDWRFS